VKLALDRHYSPLIARRRDPRAVLTNNVADFAVISRRWQTDGRSHFGLIFTSDASLPRRRDNIGRFVDALDTLMNVNPHVDRFIDRIHCSEDRHRPAEGHLCRSHRRGPHQYPGNAARSSSRVRAPVIDAPPSRAGASRPAASRSNASAGRTRSPAVDMPVGGRKSMLSPSSSS